MVDVSVVIPARNAESTLAAQLDALVEQCRDLDVEIVVVDNASVDETARVVRNYAAASSRVRLVECPTVGVNAARNAGVKHAAGALLLFVDSDDVVMRGWCRAMIQALEHSEIVGCAIDYTTLNDDFIRRVREPLGVHRLPREFGLPYPLGGNMGVQRRVWDTLGGFDETFGYGSDESEFCYRAQQAGFSLEFAPAAIVAYRLRDRLRPFLRQSRLYALGGAHFYRACLGPQTPSEKARKLAGHLLLFAKVWRLRHRLGRWRYMDRAAWFAGALQGLIRYHIMV